MCKFRNQAGHKLDEHRHPQEQTGYLVLGRARFTIDGQQHLAGPGDSWCIGVGVPHSAEALEDSVVIEVFLPLRENYLP